MITLRSNVELCLRIDGVGILIGGWVFQGEPGRVTATLHHGSRPPADVASTWVRLPRPDVVNCFKAEATAEICEANRDCGFLALAPWADATSPAVAMRLQVSFAHDKAAAAGFQLNAEQITEPLDPTPLGFLRHNAKCLVTLLRRHQLQAHPSVRRLLDALGGEANQFVDFSDTAPRLGVDLCVSGIGEGLVIAARLTGASAALASAELSVGPAETVDALPFMHFLSLAEPADLARQRRFVVAIPAAVITQVSQGLSLRLKFADGLVLAATPEVSSGAAALNRFGDLLDSETWLSLSEAIADHWPSPTSPTCTDSVAQVVRALARHAHHGTQHVIQSSAERIAAAIDRAFMVPNLGVLTIGWLADPDQQVRSLHAHIGEGPSPDLLPDVTRLVRPDIRRQYAPWLENASTDCFGFVFLARTPGARVETVESSLYYTIRTRAGIRRRLRTPVLRRCDGNPLPMIREILGHIPADDVAGLSRHVAPVIESLWKNRPEMTRKEPVFDVGEPVANPAVSIIVPIYGRYDYIEYQLSLFADDPDLRDAEIVYVIDDPRISDEAVRFCRECQPLFRLPVRVVASRHNRGFAGANNVGVAASRGRLLLLLNSDVMPKQPGWLSEMRSLYESMTNPGALGARLLYPDGSVQHAGMCFERVAHLPGIWLNGHPGKGLASSPAAKGTIAPAQAVTAACLMVSRDLYDEVGGLDESYILGDFEDSDFCLKLRQKGRQIGCASAVELYHLERQSQGLIGSNEWRTGLTMYNAWLHAKRWDNSIRQLVEGSA